MEPDLQPPGELPQLQEEEAKPDGEDEEGKEEREDFEVRTFRMVAPMPSKSSSVVAQAAMEMYLRLRSVRLCDPSDPHRQRRRNFRAISGGG